MKKKSGTSVIKSQAIEKSNKLVKKSHRKWKKLTKSDIRVKKKSLTSVEKWQTSEKSYKIVKKCHKLVPKSD